MNSPRGNQQSRAWRPDDRAAHRRTSRAARRMKVTVAIILLCGAAIGVLMLLRVVFDRSPTPTVEFASHIISSYDHFPPNAGAAADEESLAKLFSGTTGGDKARRNWVLDTEFGDRLDHAVYPGDNRVHVNRQRVPGSSVIVFWSGHSQINPEPGGEIEFPTVRDGSTGRDEDRPAEHPLPLSRLLDLLSREDAKNVFLFLDISRLEPDWSLGVLAHDSTALLKQQVDAALKNQFEQPGRPNLTVIASCSAGETSWVVPAGGEAGPKPQSAFGFYLTEALRGRCDGVENGASDHRITTRELLSYLKKGVANWAKTNRGSSQNVLILPASRSDDPSVVAFVPARPESAGAQGPAAAGSAGSDRPDANAPAGSDRADGGARDRPAAADSTKDAPAVAAGASKKSGESEARADASQTPLDLERLWGRFQDFWNNDSVLRVAPFRLRALHSNLVRAEQFLDAGLENDSRYERVLRDARDLVAALDALKSSDSNRVSPPTVEAEQAGSAIVVSEQEGQGFEAYFKSLSQPKSAPVKANPVDVTSQPPKGEPPGQTQQVAPKSEKPQPDLRDPRVAERFVNWLLDRPRKGDEASIKVFFTNLRAGWLDQGADWALLSGLYDRPEKRADGSQRIWQQAVRLRFSAAALLDAAQNAPELLPMLKAKLQPGLAAVRAAETWFFAGKEFALAGSYAERNVTRAQTLITGAAECITTYRVALRLRNRLYADLPDLARWIARSAEDPVVGEPLESDVVAALRQWARSNSQGRWIFQGPKSFNRNASTLLGLLNEADRLNRALDDLLSPDNASSLEKRCAALKEIVERINEQELNSLRERSRERDIAQMAGRGQDEDRHLDNREWHRLRAAMLLPWMAEHRDRLRRILANSVSGTPDVPNLHPSTEGVWQAYWAIEILAFAGAPPEKVRGVCQSFEHLLNEIDTADATKTNAVDAGLSESLVAARAKLGRQIKEQFDELGLAARKSPTGTANDRSLDERPIRTLDLVQSLSEPLVVGNTPDERILRNPKDKFLAELRLFAKEQRERLGEPDLSQFDASRSVEPNTADAHGHSRHKLDARPASLDFDQTNQSANMTVALKDRGSDDAKLSILLDYDPNQLRCSGVNGSAIPLTSDSLPLTFTLLKSGARDSGNVNVALVETMPGADDGDGRQPYFLHDVVSIPYTPPTHFSQWSIEFVTADGQQPHQSRHAPGVTRGWNEVTLPADGDSLKLIPRLLRPEVDAGRSIDVEVDCYALDSRGRRSEPPLFEKLKLAFRANQGPMPLVVSKMPPNDGKASDGKAPPASPAAESKKIDVTNGLRFFVRPSVSSSPGSDAATADGRAQESQYDVQFRWWSSSAYIASAQLKQVPPTIEISIQPAGEPPELDKERREASFLKDVFRVKLNFFGDFVKPVNGITGIDEVRRGGPLALLRVQLDQARLDARQDAGVKEPYSLSIDAGPWPHAFRYQCEYQSGQVQFIDVSRSASLRIASPTPYSAFVPNAKGAGAAADPNSTACKIEVGLPDDLPRDQALVLRRQIIEVADDGSDGRVLRDDLLDEQVTSSWKKSVRIATPLRTEWDFSTRIDDYNSELKYGDLVGRFLLRATLTDKNRPVLSHDVYFSVDPNPPRVVVKKEDLRDRYERSKDKFQFTVNISDDESGIKSVAVLLAKHGAKKANRQLADGDVLVFDRDENLVLRRDGYPRTWSKVVNFAQDKWPPPGDYDLYVFAEDAANHETGTEAIRTVTFVPPPAAMANNPAHKPGKLAVSFTRIGQCNLSLSEPAKQTKKRESFDDLVTFERMPPGDYKLSWDGFMGRSGSVDVTIREGETTSVTVGPR